MANQTITTNKKYSVYKITNNLNGKGYIGITSQKVERRWYTHCSTKSSTITPIKSAILKYGKSNFNFEVLCAYDTPEDMILAEQHYIEEYKTLSPLGYNLKTGGEFPIMTEEAKHNMSQARFRHFDEVGRKTQDKGYIRQRNEAYRRRKGIQTRKESWDNEERKCEARNRVQGFKHTEEAKQKIGDSKKIKIVRSDGIVFGSIEEGAKSVSRSKTSVWRVLQGDLGRHTCGGYGWKYLEEASY